MKLRLAAARAELEKLQVEELDAATTRALNTAVSVRTKGGQTTWILILIIYPCYVDRCCGRL